MEQTTKKSSVANGREHPRPLLLLLKISVVGLALLLCAGPVSPHSPLSCVLAVVSLIILLPRFGWLVPIMLASVLLSLPTNRRMMWDSTGCFQVIGAMAAGGFVLGCAFDYLAKISLKPLIPTDSSRDDAD